MDGEVVVLVCEMDLAMPPVPLQLGQQILITHSQTPLDGNRDLIIMGTTTTADGVHIRIGQVVKKRPPVLCVN
jgi:hypothetical protein